MSVACHDRLSGSSLCLVNYLQATRIGIFCKNYNLESGAVNALDDLLKVLAAGRLPVCKDPPIALKIQRFDEQYDDEQYNDRQSAKVYEEKANLGLMMIGGRSRVFCQAKKLS